MDRPITSTLLTMLAAATLAPAFGCAYGATADAGSSPGIEVLALSRGRGVPEPTRRAFDAILTLARQARADGRVIALGRRTIGLEGETRLCLEFTDTQARDRLLGEIERIAAGIDLLAVNLKDCSRNQDEQ